MGACVSLLAEVTELINCTDETFHIIERQDDNEVRWKMELKPNKKEKIRAELFLDHQKASNILSTVVVKCQGYEEQNFSGQHSMVYQKIYFKKEDEGGESLIVIESLEPRKEGCDASHIGKMKQL